MGTPSKLILIGATLLILFFPGIQHHWKTASDSYFVPADAVQYVPSFFKYDRFEAVPTTYIKEYYLEAVCPPLYKSLTALGARFQDVRRFQLGMMYLAYAVFVFIMARLGWVLGGAALSFAITALTLSGWIFFGLGFLGGAPRMYAYPLVALVLYALIRDRPRLLAVLTILGASLYPIVGVVGGLCLAAWLLLKPLSSRGQVSAWSWLRRLTVLGVTGCLALMILLPLVLSSGSYGRRIVASDIETYPEAGPDGNYRAYDQLPYKLFGHETLAYYLGPLYAHGDPLVPWTNVHRGLEPGMSLFAVALGGFLLLVFVIAGLNCISRGNCRDAGIRVIGFFAVCAALHVIAWIAAPYLYIPARYFMFSLPFVITLLFPWGLYATLQTSPTSGFSPSRQTMVFLAAITLYLMLFGGRGNVAFSGPPLDTSERGLLEQISALPKDSLIAGWPVGPLRKVEYITRRNVFLTGDLHQVLHLDFLQKMRKRMDAIFDAYLSTEAAPLIRLRDEFGVTHLVIESRNFTEPTHAPEYFSPWRSRIQPRLREIQGQEYLLNKRFHEKAAVFESDGLFLMDLSKIP